ncbi:hypothetical protein V6N13_016743 [Hibiscus sabdariffa]
MVFPVHKQVQNTPHDCTTYPMVKARAMDGGKTTVRASNKGPEGLRWQSSQTAAGFEELTTRIDSRAHKKADVVGGDGHERPIGCGQS